MLTRMTTVLRIVSLEVCIVSILSIGGESLRRCQHYFVASSDFLQSMINVGWYSFAELHPYYMLGSQVT